MTKNTYYFLINSLEGGGAERVTINLASKLIKQGKEVYIITLKSNKFYDLPLGIHHIALSKIHNNLVMFFFIPWYVSKFKKVMKEYNLSEGMSLLEIANFIHILAKENAFISFRIHISFFTGIIGWIYRLLIRWLYPRASKIIVNSEENKYDLAEYLNIPLSKVEVLYNPIDREEIVMLGKEDINENLKKQLTGKKVFITTGRLVWQKHHESIITALGKLSYSDWIYLIIGDGPEMKKLEQLVQHLGLQKHILFLGQQKNVFKYLHVADIFLYASEVEGFPNVLIEAKELGLPIITSDFKSGAREVVLGKYIKETLIYPYQGEYGWIIDPNNYEEQLVGLL